MVCRHQTFKSILGALYGPLVIHLLQAARHRTAMSAFKGTVHLKRLREGQKLELKLSVIKRLI